MGVLDRIKAVVAPPAPIAAAVVRRMDTTRSMDKPRAESRQATDAWTFFRDIGEVHYSITQQARLVGRLDWTLAIGGGEPMDTESSDAVLVAAFGEGVRDLAVKAAIHLQVPGGYSLARTVAGDPNSWQIIASSPTAAQRKILDLSDIVIEVREEDPKDPSRNDSPVLAASAVCRSLMLARAQERAQSRNRTAQHGLFVYPLEAKVNEDALTQVITAPLANEISEASVTPNLLGVGGEYASKEKFFKIDLGSEYDEKLSEKIEKLVRSLAVQLDVPPELLLGFGDTNHWSAWAIQEDNWLGHVEPLAAPIGRGFAEAIMAATDSSGLSLVPDPGPLLVRRPTPGDAMAANAAGLVSDDWTREQIGANETDAPSETPADPAVTQVFNMVTAAPSLAQAPGMDVLLEQVRAMLADGAVPGVAPEATSAPAVAEPIAASLTWDQVQARLPKRLVPVAAAVKGPDARALAAIDTQAYDSLEDLVNDTADRTLERLGAKVRSMGQIRNGESPFPADVTNADLAARFDGQIPNADATISDTIASASPKVERILSRAYARLRSEGVDLSIDPDDLTSAQSLFAELVSDVVQTRLIGGPTDAAAWQASRRVVAVAGGNPDPALMVA